MKTSQKLNPSARRAGFTLGEVMVTVALLGVVLASSIASFTYVMRNDRFIATQGELDMDASLLVERLRRDLWRTSRDQIIVYPPGDGPYQAISFPIVLGNEPITVDENGEIDWDATVVYHLKDGAPSQVRRTVFNPRIELSGPDREQQLADVALDGDGAETFNADNADTRVLIENPVEWELNVSGVRVDAYASADDRRVIQLGTALVNDGANSISFRAVGKNSANSGEARHFGIDLLSASVSGIPREGEWQTVSASEGASTVFDNRPLSEAWSGNSLLRFPANSVGSFFTLSFENDRWEERNFSGTGTEFVDVLRNPVSYSGTPSTYALRLDGNGIAWTSTNQARTPNDYYYLMPTSTAVRVFVRGSDLWDGYDGGWIGFNGTNLWARFAGGLHVESAFIAQSAVMADPANSPMDYIPSTRKDFRFGGNPNKDVWGPYSYPVESDRLDYLVETSNSYVVGIHFSPNKANYTWWSNCIPMRLSSSLASAFTNCYVVTNASPDDVAAVQWSTLPPKVYTNVVVDTNLWTTNYVLVTNAAVYPTNAIYVLASLRAGHSPRGIYTSQRIDTQLADPDFLSFDWTASQPSNSTLALKVRAWSQSDMSDAADWASLPAATPAAPPVVNGRFAQVRVEMAPGTDALSSPELRDFTLRWGGGRRYVDLAGIFSVGPNHGIYEVSVNDAKLLQGVTVKVKVFKEISLASGEKKRMESSAFAEIVPRN